MAGTQGIRPPGLTDAEVCTTRASVSDERGMTRRSTSLFLAILLAAPAGALAQNERQAESSDLARPAPLIREGEQLVSADGVLRAFDDGWVFETVHKGKVRHFTLSPSLRLGELEQVVGARGEGRYRLSGRVFVHRERNYLLLSAFSAPGIDDASPSPEQSLTGGPTVADLVRDFERQRTDRARAPGRAGEPRREATPVRREGTRVTLVRGRILQNPAGWAFFEQLTPEGALERDPATTIPVMMLPSLMLEELESLAAFSPEPPVVSLSGEFFAHQGRNYLLPTMYLVERVPSRDADAAAPSIVGETNR